MRNVCQSEGFGIIYFQEENVIDPFAMPSWRKLAWSIFFFLMVAAADIGNIIGNYQHKDGNNLTERERDGREKLLQQINIHDIFIISFLAFIEQPLYSQTMTFKIYDIIIFTT